MFLAKALRIELEMADLADVFKAESAVCALIAMDLHSRHLIKGGIDTAYWTSFYNYDGLASNMWLLVYEATLKKWIPPRSPCFVAAHPLFGLMLQKKISFYDIKKNVQTTKRELAIQRLREHMAKIIFENVDEYF